MKIAVLGAGKVGRTLGQGLSHAGHDVHYAVRDPSAAKHAALGPAARTISEAAGASDVVLLTTPWTAVESALAAAGDLTGKVLLDATNPIGPGLMLTHGHDDSGGEQVQRWAPSARVVKIFNSTGVETMAAPQFAGGRALMLACGNDEAAVQVALTLAVDLGFEALSVGTLDRARYIEPLARLWIELAMVRGQGRGIAFSLVRRGGSAIETGH